MEQIVSLSFGKENFSSMSVSLSAFIVTAPFLRTLPSKMYPRVGQVQRFPASDHPEINGYLYLDSVKVPDGSVLMLQTSHRSGAMPLRDAALFIALRASGSMLAVHAFLPQTRESTLPGTFLAFQGRGDVVEARDLGEYGLEPFKNFLTTYTDSEEIAECYTIDITAPALAAKPSFDKVEDREGNVVLAPRKPGRQLRLRRT